MKMKKAQERTAEMRRVLEILHTWGIHTLGELTALDKEQLGRRLGPMALQLWDRASGKATRLLKLVPPPEAFAESFEFEQDIELLDPLLFILRRFLEQLARRLRAVYLVVEKLELCISFSDKNSYTRVFLVPEPTTDVEVLFRMLHTHLEQFKSEDPITAVALVAQPVKPGRQQFGLFETALRNPHQLSETLARLTGLLGADRVGTPVLAETFRPDTLEMKPFIWEADETPVADPPPSSALRRFRFPARTSVQLEQEKPAHISAARIKAAVRKRSGPYVSSGNWWDHQAWQRAEWDLELEDGTVCRCHQNGETWELDGVYD
ncbi:MAG: hypothetical protein ABI795_05395 [Chthoniobacterales bacterium]